MQRVCILGLGLISGSFALALKQAGAVGSISAWARRQETLEEGLRLGVIDAGSTDLAIALEGADILVLGVPVGAMGEIFSQLKPYLRDGLIITDVGSTKSSVVAAAREAWGQIPAGFVPGHPIAGTEQIGVGAAFAELYQGRRVILTPLAETASSALETVRELWQACGAEVIDMQVEHHDEVLAATSHLPHMLAYTLVDSLARMGERDEIFEYAAGGFRDFTRIASSSPQMWHDICLANREALLAVLRRFNDDLQRLTQAIDQGDGEFLLQTFRNAKCARDRFAEKE